MNVVSVCRNHPDRPATGLCVRCRAPICPDCTTKVQGINHCLNCLSQRAKPSATAVKRPSQILAPAGTAGALAFFWFVFDRLGAWLASG